ncbi:unnamed protein product, partial [marine sediment metagenome]
MLLLGGFRVPLFFYWPGNVKEPLVKNQLVSTLDILPTIVDAAGGEVPEGIDGKSLLPQILHNDDARVRDHLAMGGIHARRKNRYRLLGGDIHMKVYDLGLTANGTHMYSTPKGRLTCV